ncbi:hypothetical protein [Thermosyntropha sp.]|uniref:hypothetical protein n=1 Tax=Thermosyntropha sp. TaxID=2740820 RepID=UPI0025D21D72|nr:hypothetical protein [Thermosyntropha sp.]MBO8158934.1 hypothetical protein [Thermosyntropha sp.]
MTLTMLTLTSCIQNKNQESISSNSSVSNNAEIQPKSIELVTKKNYKINDEIPTGNNADIIAKQGELTAKAFDRPEATLLGTDRKGNIIIFNSDTEDIERVDLDGNISIVMNIMQGRKNHVYTIKKRGDIVAWSECPHADQDPATDLTNGADWALYYANLKTKTITKVDEYRPGTVVPENAQYRYLCPNQISIASDYITYCSWEHNPDGEVTSVIKLYTMSTGKLEILDYLNEDLTNHAFGNPNVSGNKVVWCKAVVNPDGTYTGYSYLYDIKSKVKAKLVTDENIINPRISGNYIYAEGQPNKTFYDAEVCIYDIDKNEWIYKINNGYSVYKPREDYYLTDLQEYGSYLLWSSGIPWGITIFNQKDNKLYNLIPPPDGVKVDEIKYPHLLDGGLLVWYDQKYGEIVGKDKFTFRYILLK